MSNFNLEELYKGIEILETELKALKFNGYTGFFHTIDEGTRLSAQANGLNFEKIYNDTIESLTQNIKDAKNSLAELKKYL